MIWAGFDVGLTWGKMVLLLFPTSDLSSLDVCIRIHLETTQNCKTSCHQITISFTKETLRKQSRLIFSSVSFTITVFTLKVFLIRRRRLRQSWWHNDARLPWLHSAPLLQGCNQHWVQLTLTLYTALAALALYTALAAASMAKLPSTSHGSATAPAATHYHHLMANMEKASQTSTLTFTSHAASNSWCHVNQQFEETSRAFVN